MSDGKLGMYERLMDADVGTVDFQGTMLAHKNKGKWHACKKGATMNVAHACGIGGPPNPTRGDWAMRQYDISVKVVSVREYLELDVLCKNCLKKMEKEYPFTRMTYAVRDLDDDSSAWHDEVERFLNKAPSQNS